MSTMLVSDRKRALLALCAIRDDGVSVDWSLIARQAQRDRGLDALLAGQIDERSPVAEAAAPALARALQLGLEQEHERVALELSAAEKVGAHLLTVLDDEYPPNLRLVPNLPPFLFVRGSVTPADVRSVAVVGTRQATPTGLQRARMMSRLLTSRDVTVVSGLAAGIDTAAHTSALEAGGRTIAVIGTGITKCYPSENADLAERIAECGAVVSQFWPSAGPARWTFPRRNVVTSGISQGSVVVEASSTSGAKMQARIALEHGKQVFLLRSLVTDQEWARKYLARGAVEVADVEDVITRLASPERVTMATSQRQQLALELL